MPYKVGEFYHDKNNGRYHLVVQVLWSGNVQGAAVRSYARVQIPDCKNWCHRANDYLDTDPSRFTLVTPPQVVLDALERDVATAHKVLELSAIVYESLNFSEVK